MYNADSAIGCIGSGTIDDSGSDTGNYEYEPSAGEYIVGQQLAAKLGFFTFLAKQKQIALFLCSELYQAMY